MELDASFERDLREAVLDEVEQRAREEIAPTVQAHAHEILQNYGDRHDYDVESIIAAGETEVVRDQRSVTVRWGWPEPAIYFERGTVTHAVEAKEADVLSFVWEVGGSGSDPPQWVREQFDREGDGYRVFLPRTEPDGLPESRFIRDSLHYLRRWLGE